MGSVSEPTATYTVADSAAGMRLDRYLASVARGLSRTQAQALIAQGAVTVEGRPVRASHLLEAGQQVAVTRGAGIPVPHTRPPLAAEASAVPIVYEDPYLLVIDKPAGLGLHPPPGHPTGTLVNALLERLAPADGAAGAPRPGILHRLDKDTSGLLVVARGQATLAPLAAQMKQRPRLQ